MALLCITTLSDLMAIGTYDVLWRIADLDFILVIYV